MTTSQSRVRALVVDSSVAERQALVRALGREPGLEVLGWASSGPDALRAVASLHPDVITLADQLAETPGTEVANLIMRQHPTPIVMLATSTSATTSAAALAAGALAVYQKGALADHGLPRLLKSMAAVRLVRHRREPSTTLAAATPAGIAAPPDPPSIGRIELVAIGASTGGPHALKALLGALPADFPAPILVVQHTTTGSCSGLVDWLGAEIRLPVRLAAAGDPVQRPGVLIAPTDRHLLVRGPQLALDDSPPCSLHRPSATVLFRSVAAAFGPRAAGVLLTGMGDDGAAGLLDLRRAGALTVAQDRASSVVFGMPEEAIRLGAAGYVLPPIEIAELLVAHGRAV